MEWSANMLGAETKRKLKNAELQAKKEQLRIWTGYQLPVTNTTPIHNQKFTGKVSSFRHVFIKTSIIIFTSFLIF
jgi:staphylococcal nuclease domain-containing protein 1